MPTIDVSTEVLLDGVIAAVKFAVIRRRSWTDGDGIERHSHRRIWPVYGSLFPSGGNSYDRADSYQMMNKGLEIVTQFLLRSVAETRGGVQWQPDLIRWNGDDFLVEEVRDYSQYGAGFTHVSASSFDYTGVPPRGSQIVSGWLNFSDRKYSGMIGAAS